jgi:cell division protein FtsL
VDKLRGWVRGRPILWLSLTALVLLFVGVGIGASGSSSQSEVDDLNQQVDSLKSQLASAESQSQDYLKSSRKAQAQLDRIGSVQDKVHALEQQVGEQSDKLADLKGQVADEQAKLGEAQQAVAQSTFGDGTWAVGSEIPPGTYSAPGGGGCYYEVLRDLEGGLNSIITNDVGSKNPSIALNSGTWFKTEDCGTWTAGG